MFCPECGNRLELPGAKFCHICGFDLSKMPKKETSDLHKMIDTPIHQTPKLGATGDSKKLPQIGKLDSPKIVPPLAEKPKSPQGAEEEYCCSDCGATINYGEKCCHKCGQTLEYEAPVVEVVSDSQADAIIEAKTMKAIPEVYTSNVSRDSPAGMPHLRETSYDNPGLWARLKEKWGTGWIVLMYPFFSERASKGYDALGPYGHLIQLSGFAACMAIYFYVRRKLLQRMDKYWAASLAAGILSYGFIWILVFVFSLSVPLGGARPEQPATKTNVPQDSPIPKLQSKESGTQSPNQGFSNAKAPQTHPQQISGGDTVPILNIATFKERFGLVSVGDTLTKVLVLMKKEPFDTFYGRPLSYSVGQGDEALYHSSDALTGYQAYIWVEGQLSMKVDHIRKVVEGRYQKYVVYTVVFSDTDLGKTVSYTKITEVPATGKLRQYQGAAYKQLEHIKDNIMLVVDLGDKTASRKISN